MSRFRKFKTGLLTNILATGCMVLCAPLPAFADCSNTSPPTCSYVARSQTATVVPSFGNANPSCKTVTDSCQSDIMVPTGNQAEWTSFLTNHESCASLGDCDTYSWAIGGWGGCSLTCGGGTQTRSLTCQQTDIVSGITTTVADAYCGTPPPASQSCNTQACVSYAWTGFGGCSASCGGGWQYRTCYGSDGSTDPTGAACGGSTSQQCNTQACVSYFWGDWGGCSASCGGGTQFRTCYGTDGTAGNPDGDCGGSSAEACNTQSCGCVHSDDQSTWSIGPVGVGGGGPGGNSGTGGGVGGGSCSASVYDNCGTYMYDQYEGTGCT